MQPAGELTHLSLAAGVFLHLHRVSLYKTTRVDICFGEQLRRKRNTRLALISRLLERGTRTLPDLQSLNRFIDELYGAHFYTAVDRFGQYQFVHLCLEIIDDQYLAAADGDIFARGLSFLREVLLAPAGDEKEFKREYLAQEKHFLARQISDAFNDKMGYAQQRCMEEMCRGESIALSPHGELADLAEVRADELLSFHRELLQSNRMDIFVSGDFDPMVVQKAFEHFISWPRDEPLPDKRSKIKGFSGSSREIFECQDVQQAQMVLGYRTQTLYGVEDYPALILLNLILGGDGQSRLFRYLREEGGLCYYANSQVDALSGLLFVAAGIPAANYAEAKAIVEQQVESLANAEIELAEIESAKCLMQARLLGLAEDRDAYFRFQLREGLMNSGQTPESVWHKVEKVGAEDLARVAGRLDLDTAYLLHGGVEAKLAI